MERSLLDSIRLLLWVFPLSPDNFYWQLQKFAGATLRDGFKQRLGIREL